MNLHAVVWLDHQEAKVFHLTEGDFDEVVLKAPKHHVTSSHNRKDSHPRGEPKELATYFASVVKALEDSEEILLVGPGSGKLAFLKYVHRSEPRLEARIVGVESADHPTDRQIVAHARSYFRAHDRMKGHHVGV